MDNVTRMHLRPADDTVAVARVVGLIEPGVPRPRTSPESSALVAPALDAPANPAASPAARRRTGRGRAWAALAPWLVVAVLFGWVLYGPWLLGVRAGR